jgi:hypothetical protein
MSPSVSSNTRLPNMASRYSSFFESIFELRRSHISPDCALQTGNLYASTRKRPQFLWYFPNCWRGKQKATVGEASPKPTNDKQVPNP